MDRVIKNDTAPCTPEPIRTSRPTSEYHSESSSEGYDTQSFLKHKSSKHQIASDIDPSALTDRRLKLFEQENETPKLKLKRLKHEHNEYKAEAEEIMTILHQRLAES